MRPEHSRIMDSSSEPLGVYNHPPATTEMQTFQLFANSAAQRPDRPLAHWLTDWAFLSHAGVTDSSYLTANLPECRLKATSSGRPLGTVPLTERAQCEPAAPEQHEKGLYVGSRVIADLGTRRHQHKALLVLIFVCPCRHQPHHLLSKSTGQIIFSNHHLAFLSLMLSQQPKKQSFFLGNYDY